jgi:hypothetical protein
LELHREGRAANYDYPENPLFVSLPTAPTAGTSTNAYVAVKTEATGNVIMPYSIFKDDEVLFQTASTGTFDVIYNAITFSDVGQHWASQFITFVSTRGLFVGNGNDTFSPESSMNRAMFAQVLANIEAVDLSAYSTSRFTDVAADAWYSPAVQWAASVGIVNGYGNGLYGPTDNITREQMAVMLSNYIRYKGYDLPEGETIAFNDEGTIAPWAIDAVNLMQSAGIVRGRLGNLYAPKAAATRAEVATIYANFINIYGECATSPR